MILAQVNLEWGAIGVICGVVSTLVGASVTLCTIYLKQFVSNALHNQSEQILNRVRQDFIQKDLLEQKLQNLETKVAGLKEQIKHE